MYVGMQFVILLTRRKLLYDTKKYIFTNYKKIETEISSIN